MESAGELVYLVDDDERVRDALAALLRANGRTVHTFDSGSTTYSANAPSRLTPTLDVRMHRWRRPARQLRHVPHTTCPSPLTI